MKFTKNNKKRKGIREINNLISNSGFTLIEMLVVVAIIGLLAAVVLSEVEPVKDKAKDTRIIQEVNQVRSVAETMYQGNYERLEELPKLNIKDSDLKILSDDISAQGGELYINKSNNETMYAVYTRLNVMQGEEPDLEIRYYCTDSAGHSIISTRIPQFPKKYVCPSIDD